MSGSVSSTSGDGEQTAVKVFLVDLLVYLGVHGCKPDGGLMIGRDSWDLY